MATYEDNFENRVARFEDRWMTWPPADLGSYLPDHLQADSKERTRVLIELICVDLEFRWRTACEASGVKGPLLRKFLPQYVEEFPELGELKDLPIELIGEEYRALQRWGRSEDRPTDHEKFIDRYGRHRTDVARRLAQIDEELWREQRRSWSALDADRRTVSIPPSIVRFEYSQFLLQKMIGQGGSGKVFRAIEISTGRSVAIKFLKKSFLSDAGAVERFVAEAGVLSGLNQPGIVNVEGLGTTSHGGYFLVMELVQGIDLETLRKQGPNSVNEALRWTIAACDLISLAHARQVVHCDLKLANLLLDAGGRIFVTDFGLARSLVERGDGIGRNDGMGGTAPFMAPEQISDVWGEISVRTDVYGLGAVLYCLLADWPPPPQHPGKASGARLVPTLDLLSRIVSGAPACNPRELNEHVPAVVADACMKALAKSPSERYATAAEMSAALRAIQVDLNPTL